MVQFFLNYKCNKLILNISKDFFYKVFIMYLMFIVLIVNILLNFNGFY